MAMTTGRRRGGSLADINVTPMIDVLLVLLIVFMVLQEGLRRGIPAQVPPPDGEARPAPPRPLRRPAGGAVAKDRAGA
jgi:biopolymer transport protein ExbD